MTSTKGTRIAAALVASAALVALAACSSSSKSSNPLAPSSAPSAPAASGSSAASDSTPIVVGGNNFAESTVLADIYGSALSAKGFKVTYKLNIGSREISYGLLKSGAVTVMPEYNGSLLAYLDPKAAQTSLDGVQSELAAKLATNLEALTPSAAEDKDSLTLNAATAAKYHLTADSTIEDLKPYASKLTLGASPEFQTRQEGLKGLASEYGLNFKSFKALDPGGPLSEAALKKNNVQVADIFTTDTMISSEHWISLKDPKNLFGFANVLPVGAKTLPSGAVTVLNAVDAKLDTAALLSLDTQVGQKGADPLNVAQTWLKAQGLA